MEGTRRVADRLPMRGAVATVEEHSPLSHIRFNSELAGTVSSRGSHVGSSRASQVTAGRGEQAKEDDGGHLR